MAQCTATSKSTGARCKRPAHPGYNVCYMHGANPQNHGGAPAGNKNGLVTGRNERITWDTLSDEERAAAAALDTDPGNLIDLNIRLTVVRINRMLRRIADLTGTEFVTMERLLQRGTMPAGPINVTTHKDESALALVHRIEEALTKVQTLLTRQTELRHRMTSEQDDGAIMALVEAIAASRRRLRQVMDESAE